MSQLQLEGRAETRDADGQLRRENLRLHEELRLTNLALSQAQSDKAGIVRGVEEVRNTLSPLYRSLRLLFGEIEAVTGAESPAITGNGTANLSRWEAIKQRNPGRIAQAIDVLLLHGAMSTNQLAAAMRMDRSNCSKNVVVKMKSMGLIIKTGHEFSLKEL